MEAEERAQEAERYAEHKRKRADEDFEDSVRLAKDLEKTAKDYIESCYKEYNEDFDKCRNLLTNIRNDISELEQEVDELWDEDFRIDVHDELQKYLERHCVVVGGKRVSLYDDFVKKIEEKKRRRAGTVGNSVKKIKERVSDRLEGIDDVEKFLQMRCETDYTEEIER